MADHDALVVDPTPPDSNGPTEGVVTNTAMLKRQTYGNASCPLLRTRVLLMG